MSKKTTKGCFLETLLKSSQTVFSVKDLSLLWGEEVSGATRTRLNYYVKKGKLIRVYHGFYAKDENYNRFELAGKIYTPSYISFETVLARTGVIFQGYKSTFLASYVTRNIKTEDQRITYIRMKDYVLSNTLGIEYREGVAFATKERAFLDRVYTSQNYHFDNLNILNWDEVFTILPIYGSEKMKKKVNEYYQNYEQ